MPSLIPLSVRKVGFEIRGTAPAAGETAALELRLERKTSGRSEIVGRRSTRRRSICAFAGLGQTHTRTFRSSIDGSLQYYAVVPALAGPPTDARAGWC